MYPPKNVKEFRFILMTFSVYISTVNSAYHVLDYPSTMEKTLSYLLFPFISMYPISPKLTFDCFPGPVIYRQPVTCDPF